MGKFLRFFVLTAITGFAVQPALANCPNVVAAFTTSVTNICGPGATTISFVNTSTGTGNGGATYDWYRNGVLFDNTTGLTAPNTSTISAVGTYTFMVIATNAANTCSDSAIQTVRIWPIPNASFTFTPNNQCAGLPVSFTNTSTGTATGTTYSWNFGDATTSTQTNPNHTYAAGGTYTVTLVVTNFAGCTSTATMVVTALPIPAISIFGDDGDGDTQYCLLPGDPATSEVVTFTNFTTGAVNYSWDFGDGSPVVNTASNAALTHTYSTYGTYTVTMTATGPNGCTATGTIVVIFERYVGASFSVPIAQMSGCIPLTVTPVNASQNATTYVWNFGDGSPLITTTTYAPPSHTYTVSGTYTITLTASNSCNTSTSTVSPIIVVDRPNVNFTATPNPGCAPQVVTFQNTSTGVQPANNYQWNFGNGNTQASGANAPPQTYGQGTYTVTLIGGNGCGTDTMIRVIVIDTIPDVNLIVNPTNGCTPLTVTATNTSVGGALSYAWYVDNVFISSAVNIPPQTFTAPAGNTVANHTIRLVVSNHCGTRDSIVNITVHPAVQAVFTPVTSTICAGGSVTFTQTSFGDQLTYAWDFGNGNLANTAGPHTQTYNTAGTYTVSLTVTGFCGTSTQTATVTVNPMPTASITPSVTSGCEDLIVNFTNGSTAGGTYAWNFGATSSPATSTAFTPPPVTFSTPGTQTVTLTVTVLGCVATTSVTITVLPRPVSSFTTVPASGCTPLAVTYNNTTTATAGNSYTWTFGNGNTSSSQNPGGQTYIANANDSTYTIELLVTNSSGCSDSMTQTVTVHPLPVASFTMSADTVCALDNIFFTNASTGINTYAWTFGDAGTSATTNPVHAYANPGNYLVTLIATTNFGCRDTITAPVMVDSIPAVAFSASVECVGDSTSFTNTSTGSVASWSWNFGDATSGTQQSPSHLYTTAGNYTVTLTAMNFAGCSSSITHTATVNIVPVAAFASSTACVGQSTAFTDQTTGSPNNWTWNYGDLSANGTTQNPTHVYGAAGTYTTTLVVASGSGCSDTITGTVVVNPVPTAAFSFVSVCANDTTFFTSTSLGNPTTFFWDFGDGNQDNTNNPGPQHIYLTGGSFNVTLTAGYATGCTNTVIVPVTVYPRTVPAFTSNVPCLGGTTNFTDNTTNTPTTWQWDFGDGSPVNSTQNPAHVYAVAGTYPVTLVTSNSFGCVDSITTNVQVYPLPVANFTADTVCEGFASAFTDLSTSAVGWSWNFGDLSALGSQANPTHIYTTQGTYTVTLVVTNPQGCTDTIQQTIVVRPNPVSSFTASIACHTYPTLYTDNSTSALTWTWDFGDGSPLNATQSPSYVFANPGTYNTSLVVSNIYGCTDTSAQQVTVLPQPQAGFVSTTVCAESATTFTDTTTGAPGVWTWDFGDGSPVDANQDPSHTYLVGGTYQVTLIAGNSAGCIDTLVTSITVNTVPYPAFTANQVCLGNITSFTDQTFDPTPLGNWLWDFGDGNNSFQSNPNYIYQNPGTYTVTLTVMNTSGCDSTITGTVTVTGIPVADFIYDTVCVGSATTFTDISTGSPSSWLWDFGDSQTSATGPVTTHVYATPGTYLASVIVSGGAGCTDQAFHIVTVSNTVQAAMTLNPSACENDLISFLDNSIATTGTVTSWSWDFGDGSPLDTLQNTTHAYPLAGTYTITLTAAGSSGCSSVATQILTINPLPVAAFNSTSACENQLTQFTDISNGNVTSWQWDFGDNSGDVVQNPTHQYANSGAYFATLIVTTATGCSDTLIKQVTVFPQPTALFTTDTVCYGDSTQFTDLSVGNGGNINNWTWNFDDGQFGFTQDPQHAFVVMNDSFYVMLIVQTADGCIDTATQLVITYPVPDMNFGPLSASGCEDFTAQFTDSTLITGAGIINWLWDLGDGNYSYSQNPTHTYTDDGSYYIGLTVTTTDGCVFTDSLSYPVVVYPKPIADFIPSPQSTSILTPDIAFIDQSVGAMFWEWDFGDFDGSIIQNPTHTYNDSGWYNVTQIVINSYGCRDTVVIPVRIEAEYQFFIPNAFTPNGNGNNDYFMGEGIGIAEFQMLIFDRWGNQIFKSTDQYTGWDGKLSNGDLAQIDVYVYKIMIRDVFGENHTYIGHVSLVR
jgi:gliding motility-associated-like protein